MAYTVKIKSREDTPFTIIVSTRCGENLASAAGLGRERNTDCRASGYGFNIQ